MTRKLQAMVRGWDTEVDTGGRKIFDESRIVRPKETTMIKDIAIPLAGLIFITASAFFAVNYSR